MIFFAKLAEDTPPGKRSGQAIAIVKHIIHFKITTLINSYTSSVTAHNLPFVYVYLLQAFVFEVENN